MAPAAAAAAPSILQSCLKGWAAFKTVASPALASYAKHLPIQFTKKVTVAKLQAFGFPEVKDLWDGILVAILLTLLRVVLTHLVLDPLGRWCMQHKYYTVKSSPIPRIDEVLKENKLPMLHEKQKLAKELSMTAQDVSDYMRKWRNHHREARALHKFTEVAWKFIVHVAVTYFGVAYILLRQPYTKNMTLCWSSYPFSPLPKEVYWYYMFEFGIYVHEIVFHFLEAKRSDFWEMLVHHVATLALISGSYTYNYIPIGTLVMVVHDAADSLLELAKLFNYVTNVHKWAQTITDLCFIAFAVVFGITRCIIFPTYIIHNTFTEPLKYVYQGQVSTGLLNGFLCVLLCLHIFWMSLILKMAVKMMASGEVTKDDRSDDEGSYLEPSLVVSKSQYEKEE